MEKFLSEIPTAVSSRWACDGHLSLLYPSNTRLLYSNFSALKIESSVSLMLVKWTAAKPLDFQKRAVGGPEFLPQIALVTKFLVVSSPKLLVFLGHQSPTQMTTMQKTGLTWDGEQYVKYPINSHSSGSGEMVFWIYWVVKYYIYKPIQHDY